MKMSLFKQTQKLGFVLVVGWHLLYHSISLGMHDCWGKKPNGWAYFSDGWPNRQLELIWLSGFYLPSVILLGWCVGWSQLLIQKTPNTKEVVIYLRWWFQIFFIFTNTWEWFPFWLIFFRWVETTNQYGWLCIENMSYMIFLNEFVCRVRWDMFVSEIWFSPAW